MKKMKCLCIHNSTIRHILWTMILLTSVFSSCFIANGNTEEQSMAATQAFEKGRQKEQQLEYLEAQKYYEYAIRLDPGNSEYLDTLGILFYKLGEYQKTITYCEQALNIARQTHGEQHPDVAIELNNLGLAWRAMGEYEKAIEALEQALSINCRLQELV